MTGVLRGHSAARGQVAGGADSVPEGFSAGRFRRGGTGVERLFDGAALGGTGPVSGSFSEWRACGGYSSAFSKARRSAPS